MSFELSKLSSDFEDILTQLVAHKNTVASTNPQVWKDFMTSSVGQTFLELMAGSVAFNQFYIEASFREAFPNTALRDSSIYASSRLLGVNIERKRPAALGIKLLNTTGQTVVIGKNSEFVVDGNRFFNREEIVLNASNNFVVGKRIFEGYVKLKSLGEIIKSGDVYLNEPGFVVSSYPGDLVLAVRNTNTSTQVNWSPAESSLYSYNHLATVYYMNTAGNGDVVFTFGDGVNGAIPGYNTDTIVQYIITQGSAVNKAVNSITGGSINSRLGIYYSANTGIKVEIDDTAADQLGIYGGTDEKSADYYKTYAPYLYRARHKAVTKTDYIAIVMGLGGIASVVVEAQRDLNPSRVDFMNVVHVCALPSSAVVDSFTVAEKQAFITDLNRYIHACIRVLFTDPEVVLIKLKVTAYTKATYDSGDVKNNVIAAFTKFFEKNPASLGRKIYLSDLISLCMKTGGVDHCKIEEQSLSGNIPFTDKIPSHNKVFYKLDVPALDVVSIYTDRSDQSVDTFV